MTVSLTWATPGAIDPALIALLGAHERDRHDRLARPPDRQRFLAAHVLARLVLAEKLRCQPQHVPLRQNCDVCSQAGHGRPFVDGGPWVSLAHAGDRVVVAVSEQHAVGVDVEDPSLFASVPPAATLGAAERRHPGWTPLARARNWVCKEAALKATGVGLRIDPRDVRLSSPDGAAHIVDWPLPARPALAELDVGGYPAAVAVMSTQCRRSASADRSCEQRAFRGMRQDEARSPEGGVA